MVDWRRVLNKFSLLLILVAIGLAFYTGLTIGVVKQYVCYTGYREGGFLQSDQYVEGGCYETNNTNYTCSALYTTTKSSSVVFMLEKDVEQLNKTYKSASQVLEERYSVESPHEITYSETQ